MEYRANEGRYDAMPYIRAGKSGLQLPRISLGIWHNFGHVDRYETARETLRTAFDLGITHVDAANNYGPPPGSAEENLGKALARSVDFYNKAVSSMENRLLSRARSVGALETASKKPMTAAEISPDAAQVRSFTKPELTGQ